LAPAHLSRIVPERMMYELEGPRNLIGNQLGFELGAKIGFDRRSVGVSGDLDDRMYGRDQILVRQADHGARAHLGM
jgi:hypothetical protein